MKYHSNHVKDFDELVGQSFDLESPSRSTVPLLAYWSNPEIRLAEFGAALGLAIPPDAGLTFEHAVSPAKGTGKPSHTDLMIVHPSLVIGIEAKSTESKYELVSKWLGITPKANKILVLESWLDMINRANGCRLTIEGAKGIPYELIHRTASVCRSQAQKRAVVYHCFDPTASRLKTYADQLRQLATLVAAPDKLLFFLFATAPTNSNSFAQLHLESVANKKTDASTAVRKLLRERNVATFGPPIVKRF